MTDVISVVTNMFTQIFSLFERLFTSFGITSYLLGGFFIWTAYRFLLKPIIGGGVGSSDKARRGKKGDINE